ncbi:hypothetical protein, partial [Streptomyces kasugaensis]
DERRAENAAGGARTGPRHAAPRKPLLTRLHMPAGKAIAIAAMPTAVLMGIGITPQLAIAKPVPESPFKDGPCVTAPDQHEQEAQQAAKDAKAAKAAKDAKEKAAGEQATKDAADARDGQGTADPDPAGRGGGADSRGGTPSGGAVPPAGSSAAKEGGAPSSPAGTPAPGPSAGSSPTPSADGENPWYDPLGLGKKIHDALHPGEGKAAGDPASSGATPSGAPTPSASTGTDGGTDKDSGTGRTKDAGAPTAGKAATGPGADTAGGSGGPADKDKAGDGKDTDGKAADDENADGKAADGKDTDGKDTATATPSAPSPSGSADAPDADGKKPFPCVTEKKSAGTDEQAPATVPNDPWQLESSALTLSGLDYKGVVNLTMPNGRTKQALKFTATSVDIGDLHQIVAGPEGRKYHVQAAKGSTSTIRGGTVTMYTERLEGNLFGLIPIVFDPEHPPPINIPFAYFTKVKITQAGQFGGDLTVPGMRQSITG